MVKKNPSSTWLKNNINVHLVWDTVQRLSADRSDGNRWRYWWRAVILFRHPHCASRQTPRTWNYCPLPRTRTRCSRPPQTTIFERASFSASPRSSAKHVAHNVKYNIKTAGAPENVMVYSRLPSGTSPPNGSFFVPIFSSPCSRNRPLTDDPQWDRKPQRQLPIWHSDATPIYCLFREKKNRNEKTKVTRRRLHSL